MQRYDKNLKPDILLLEYSINHYKHSNNAVYITAKTVCKIHIWL